MNVSLGQVVTYGLNVSCTLFFFFFVFFFFFFIQKQGLDIVECYVTFYIFIENDFQE